MRSDRIFADIASAISRVSGRPLTFAVVCLLVFVWAISGPLFRLSDTWQLLINTGSSIITLLMVFLIQNTQARDSEAMHAKLDEVLRCLPAADQRLIGIERLPDREIETFRARSLPPEPPAL